MAVRYINIPKFLLMIYLNPRKLNVTDVLPMQKEDCDHDNFTFGRFLVTSLNIS